MDKIRRSSGSAWNVGSGLSGARPPPKPPDNLPPTPNLLPAPSLQNPFTQSTTSIPSESKKVSFNEADYNSIVDNFIAKGSFGKQIKTKEPKLSTKVVDCQVDLQNQREIEDVDALRLLDRTKGFMSTTKLLGKIETSSGFCLLSALFWLVL
jgi:hypothetical protein